MKANSIFEILCAMPGKKTIALWLSACALFLPLLACNSFPRLKKPTPTVITTATRVAVIPSAFASPIQAITTLPPQPSITPLPTLTVSPSATETTKIGTSTATLTPTSLPSPVKSATALTSTASATSGTATSVSTQVTETSTTSLSSTASVTIANTLSATAESATPSLSATAPSPVFDSLQALNSAVVPERDSRLLAEKFGIATNIPQVVQSSPPNHTAGQLVNFSAENIDTRQRFTLPARLEYTTPHVYFFVDARLTVDPAAVKSLVDKFENNLYPTTRALFGFEWFPGVDSDPRLYILYAGGLGSGVLGYFSAADEYSRLAIPNSNEKEMFYINANLANLQSTYLESVLAHEFQHMIHWANDKNEDSWLNEGASDLASIMNGYTSVFIPGYLADTDLQLNTWDSNSSHYGASSLFLNYLRERFGDSVLSALVGNQMNGLASVQDTFAHRNILDATRGQTMNVENFFVDWTVANYLNNPALLDGRYGYRTSGIGKASVQNPHSNCNFSETYQVRQFGADYHQLTCVGNYTLTFKGDTVTTIAAIPPQEGKYFLWGNRQDNSDTSLTRTFDLRNVSRATLSYKMWYDLEPDYDFAYISVSNDGGKLWQILPTVRTHTFENSFGMAYNGLSDGWVQETLDLSAYAGQVIQIRWEYITDDAMTHNGLALDEIKIPELDFYETFEGTLDGWDLSGFVRIDNLLAQKYRVQVIQERASGTPLVTEIQLKTDNTGEMSFSLAQGEKLTIVISGVTMYSTIPASYNLQVK